MAPDFHYFIALAPKGTISHSMAGAFYLDLPLALLALCFFHWVLKLPLLSLFPRWHQQRLILFAVPFRLESLKKFLLVTVSLLVGIFSHLLWDSFTHGRGWMVHHIALLRTTPFQQSGNSRPVYVWLQHASTVIGLVVLITAYRRWSRTVTPGEVPEKFRLSNRVKLGVVVTIGILAAAAGTLYGFERSHHATHFSNFAAYSAISFVTLFMTGLVIFSVFWHHTVRLASTAT